VLVVLGCTLFMACTSTTLQQQSFKSYTIGAAETRTVGDPFLVDQDGSVSKVKRWVGLLNSPDGWQVSDYYSEDYVRKELIYGGKSGSTVEIQYREFRGGMAAPAFYQSVKYDLAQSDVVRFQKFAIKIIKADNQTITYEILGDSGTPIELTNPSVASTVQSGAVTSSGGPGTSNPMPDRDAGDWVRDITR
jgi:hypothetical protein